MGARFCGHRELTDIFEAFRCRSTIDDRTKGWKHTFTHADLDDSSGHDSTKWIKVGIAKEGRNALAKFSISIGNAGAWGYIISEIVVRFFEVSHQPNSTGTPTVNQG